MQLGNAIYTIALLPLEFQREIVGHIEAEWKIVEGNRELMRIYEEKVKKVIPLRGRCEKVCDG